MSEQNSAGGLIASLKDSPLLTGVLDALLPFIPALKRMAFHYLMALVANLEADDWKEVTLKLGRASKDDEVRELPTRAGNLRMKVMEVEKEHGKLVRDVVVRVAVALAVAAL